MKVSNCAQRLRLLLEINNLRQVDLVNLTNIPKSAISNYLSGTRIPRQDRIDVIATKFNVSPAWLMGYDTPMRDIRVQQEEQENGQLIVDTNCYSTIKIKKERERTYLYLDSISKEQFDKIDKLLKLMFQEYSENLVLDAEKN